MRSVDNSGLYMYILHYVILAQTLTTRIASLQLLQKIRLKLAKNFTIKQKDDRGSRGKTVTIDPQYMKCWKYVVSCTRICPLIGSLFCL